MGGIDFGPAAALEMREVYLRWHVYWLKGIANDVEHEPPIKIFVMGKNYWRFENEWPLARTRYTKYCIASKGKANSLAGDGVLQPAPPEGGAAADTFVYDPAVPVPTLGVTYAAAVYPRARTTMPPSRCATTCSCIFRRR